VVCYKEAANLIENLKNINFLWNKTGKYIIYEIYNKLIQLWYFRNEEIDSLNVWLKLFI
jgi:hypothetical protein